MEDWQIKDQNLYILANRLHEMVGQLRISMTAETIEAFTHKWLEDQEDEEAQVNLPSPVEMQVEYILSQIKFKVPEDFVFNVIQGYVGTHMHKWMEVSYFDLIRGPHPQVFIIDPAVIGVQPHNLLITPDSPYRLLYKGQIRSELGG